MWCTRRVQGARRHLLLAVVRRLQEVLRRVDVLWLLSSISEEVVRGWLAPASARSRRASPLLDDEGMRTIDRQGDPLSPVLELLLEEEAHLGGVIGQVQQVGPAGCRRLRHLEEEGLRVISESAELLDCERDETMYTPQRPGRILVLTVPAEFNGYREK